MRSAENNPLLKSVIDLILNTGVQYVKGKKVKQFYNKPTELGYLLIRAETIVNGSGMFNNKLRELCGHAEFFCCIFLKNFMLIH